MTLVMIYMQGTDRLVVLLAVNISHIFFTYGYSISGQKIHLKTIVNLYKID